MRRHPLLHLYLICSLLGLTGCGNPYEERRFDLISEDTEWGTVFINITSSGRSTQNGVRIYGAPYTLTFAPRLKSQPALDCQLTVEALALKPLSGRPGADLPKTLNLAAEPSNPSEPNSANYSDFFSWVPVEEVYMAVGAVEGLDLPYEPHHLALDLVGGPTCPKGLRTPFHFEADIQTRPSRGTEHWYDAMMSV